MISSFVWHGKTDYLESLALMERAAGDALATGKVTVLGFEYATTITLGRRAQTDAQAWIKEATNTPVVPVSRGGLATLHNDGQCVIYPVVPLKNYGLFAKEWVDILTETTGKSLLSCNIIVNSTDSGVFTPSGKIASVGIHIKKGVSTHGIAVNISNSLEDFARIIPCGIDDQRFDRVINYGPLSTEEFFRIWSEQFERSFGSRPRPSLTNTPAYL